MFITVSGQKGGVAKTCTSIHLATYWALKGLKVCVVDADRNRSALAYDIRGKLPFNVVPVEAAAKLAVNHCVFAISLSLLIQEHPLELVGKLENLPVPSFLVC